MTNSEREALEAIARAIWGTLESPNEADRNLENANVVDGLFSISRAIHHVARAIEGVKSTDPKEASDADPA